LKPRVFLGWRTHEAIPFLHLFAHKCSSHRKPSPNNQDLSLFKAEYSLITNKDKVSLIASDDSYKEPRNSLKVVIWIIQRLIYLE
jgi:hypothetical protein